MRPRPRASPGRRVPAAASLPASAAARSRARRASVPRLLTLAAGLAVAAAAAAPGSAAIGAAARPSQPARSPSPVSGGGAAVRAACPRRGRGRHGAMPCTHRRPRSTRPSRRRPQDSRPPPGRRRRKAGAPPASSRPTSCRSGAARMPRWRSWTPTAPRTWPPTWPRTAPATTCRPAPPPAGACGSSTSTARPRRCPPPTRPGWGVEETLDVSMVSAACPRCKILVVEASVTGLRRPGRGREHRRRGWARPRSPTATAPAETGYTQAYAAAYRPPRARDRRLLRRQRIRPGAVPRQPDHRHRGRRHPAVAGQQRPRLGREDLERRRRSIGQRLLRLRHQAVLAARPALPRPHHHRRRRRRLEHRSLRQLSRPAGRG